ncbi:1-deoxy-D-xylulose 5-phosphate reductoisomerase [Spirochaetia bacterium]|nr:1-deoxy-D-xylulose 5-phosphate reductoisomerase [Spirochaetia bacterium]
MKKRVAVLGATGSIGKSTLDVLRAGKEYFTPVLFSSHTDSGGLLKIGSEFPSAALALSGLSKGPEEVAYYGREGLLRAIAESRPDIAVNGISGAAGLEPSLAVLDTGADLALANKETIVMAAPLVFARAQAKKARILPVDSEHSALFNLSEAHGGENITELLLTASGGPFRTYSREQLAAVTPRDALAHPTWKMGAKITVDSASLANKGLEVIEAACLFKVPPEKITVVVHPQSIVHSMVRLRDGAVYAQLSRPDMRLPIHSALYYPEQRPCSFGALDFASPDFGGLNLEFEKPDAGRFPMLPLAYEAGRRGGLYPAAYNAANEAAVTSFLQERIGFLDIPRLVEYVLEGNWNRTNPSLEVILETDARARKRAEDFIERK